MTHPVAVETPEHLIVVLPVYNEADSIAAVLAEIAEAAQRLAITGVRTSCILVDDESPDGTGAIAVDAAQRYRLPLTTVVGQRAGLGDAMLRGLAAALQEVPTAVVTLDGDGQHNPADIPTLYRAFVARSADIAIGSRWTRGGSAPGTTPGRAVGSIIGNWAFRLVTGTRGVKDATTSFRIYSPAALRVILASDSQRFSGYSFFSTTIALAEAHGLVITEVPIEFRPRYSGQSKLNRREVWRYFSTLGQLRTERRKLLPTHDDPGPYRAADELKQLSEATAWNTFVVEKSVEGIETRSVRSILEVGAGRGGITARLRERFPDAVVTAIEPDAANHSALHEAFADDDHVITVHGTLADWSGAPADLIVYYNVLEHIDHDTAELKSAREALRPNGWLSIFVPANEAIYGPIDAKSGHYRRYTAAHLCATVTDAGLEVQHISYADRLGVVPYWINYRLLNKSTIAESSATLFDRVYVPLMRSTERLLGRLSFGKNLVAVARRPES
ncbi:bifunctional glycosyltransferase/class I SAM-dependent methyltransferase [Desertimonas flava]|uniref:bifunctional glycosyltransferase/class I SAM-dependent methyltransferase n=1 Tax=Desertimonas flava TaxID=2064846 RepID=UPI000E34A48B|nr:bifunctional glycosyltransferase/class I SAM-dependent methyltransferase [Desertimonas flava]